MPPPSPVTPCPWRWGWRVELVEGHDRVRAEVRDGPSRLAASTRVLRDPLATVYACSYARHSPWRGKQPASKTWRVPHYCPPPFCPCACACASMLRLCRWDGDAWGRRAVPPLQGRMLSRISFDFLRPLFAARSAGRCPLASFLVFLAPFCDNHSTTPLASSLW